MKKFLPILMIMFAFLITYKNPIMPLGVKKVKVKTVSIQKEGVYGWHQNFPKGTILDFQEADIFIPYFNLISVEKKP